MENIDGSRAEPILRHHRSREQRTRSPVPALVALPIAGVPMSVIIRFACGACGKPIALAADHVGRLVKCGGCGGALTVPAVSQSVARQVHQPVFAKDVQVPSRPLAGRPTFIGSLVRHARPSVGRRRLVAVATVVLAVGTLMGYVVRPTSPTRDGNDVGKDVAAASSGRPRRSKGTPPGSPPADKSPPTSPPADKAPRASQPADVRPPTSPPADKSPLAWPPADDDQKNSDQQDIEAPAEQQEPDDENAQTEPHEGDGGSRETEAGEQEPEQEARGGAPRPRKPSAKKAAAPREQPSRKDVDDLLKRLEAPHPAERMAAAGLLGRPGLAEYKNVVSSLIAALDDVSEGVQLAAIQALGALGPSAKATVPVLIERLDHDSDAVQLAAIQALGFLGPSAKAAAPVLIERCKALPENADRNAQRYWQLLRS